MQRPLLVLIFILGLTQGTPAFGEDVTELIESIRLEHKISAAAYFIVSPDSIITLESLGTTQCDNDITFEVDHLVRIGSITKTFTALATIILNERGVLSLNDTVTDLVSEPLFENPWAEQNPVKIAHLLEHTAGLRDMSKREFDFNEPISLTEAFRVDPSSRLLEWPPGLHSSYSNSGAGILSRLIEQVTDKTYETFVSDEIFSPLGMSSARFTIAAPERDKLITGYDGDGCTEIEYWHTLYRAFGAISVTPQDMIPFVQLFLNRGEHAAMQLVSKAAIERMQTPRTSLSARAGLEYGYGLGIYQYQRGGVSFFGHGGDADGYLAYFSYSPALQRGYFVVINSFNNEALRKIRRVIEDKIVGNAMPNSPPSAQPSSSQLATISGTYRQVTRRFGGGKKGSTIEVSVAEDGAIYTSAKNGRGRALLPVTPWHYRRREQTVATISFIPCGDQLYLQGDFGNYAKSGKGEQLAPCPPQAVTTQRTPVPPMPQ